MVSSLFISIVAANGRQWKTKCSRAHHHQVSFNTKISISNIDITMV